MCEEGVRAFVRPFVNPVDSAVLAKDYFTVFRRSTGPLFPFFFLVSSSSARQLVFRHAVETFSAEQAGQLLSPLSLWPQTRQTDTGKEDFGSF